MRVLVASDGHGLLPFAWRLRREDVDVDVLVFRDKYEAAWEGIPIEKIVRGRDKSKQTLTALRELAEAGEMVVLTDSKRGLAIFGEAPQAFCRLPTLGSGIGALALGAWFDGEAFRLEHLLFNDWGLWPGGLGPEVLGGMVLARGRCALHEQMAALAPELATLKFKGLVSAQLVGGAAAKPSIGQVELGWPQLQSEAFLSDLDSFSALLAGSEAALLSRFVVAVPVTVPPFPIRGPGLGSRQVEGLEAGDAKTIFFHDFKTNGDGHIWTAGLDGYVCVVRGSGSTLALARARALEKAGKIRVREKQVRMDVGGGADFALGVLAEQGIVLDG